VKGLRNSLKRLLDAGFESADWIVSRSPAALATTYQFRGRLHDQSVGFLFKIADDAADNAYIDIEDLELQRAEDELLKEARKNVGSPPLAAQREPRLIIVTRVLGDGYGDGHDAYLGPTDWRAIDHRDGTHTLVVAPELEARARELFPGVPVEW
jgi:hypothetical protein